MNVCKALLSDLWWDFRDDTKLKLYNLILMLYFKLLYFTARLMCIVF